METTSIISITLGIISILLGFVSIYIAFIISKITSNIEQKADNKALKDIIKDVEEKEDIFFNNDDIDTAITLMQGKEHNAEYYYLLGLKEYKNEYYNDAENYFQKAINLKNGKYPAALFFLGHTYLKQSKSEGDEFYNKAKNKFEEAKDLGHKNAEKRLNRMK